jgi:triosephosphate isomerase (TIM)
MRNKLVIGNWKMNGCLATIQTLLDDLLSETPNNLMQNCVVLPPSIYLSYVSKALALSAIKWGVQNIYPLDSGAYTGEISGKMAQDFACRYVLVGHSERRRYFHEDEKFIAEKFHYVVDHDMIPILCVGETQEERNQGLTETVLQEQLRVITSHSVLHNCVVAYEPVWAIGTGVTPTPDKVQAVHAFIRSCLSQIDVTMAQNTPILYGGSLNNTNSKAMFAMPDVDGGLIGAASLSAKTFVEILKCIN